MPQAAASADRREPQPVGSLERSLAAITIGLVQGGKQRAAALADTYTGEYDQQVHVPLSGVAAASWAYTDEAVQWEMPFLYAPLQHRFPFTTPHFTYGIEITAGTGSLVVIHAQVIAWTVTDANWYVGATVRFAVSAPGADPTATTGQPYAATAHLTFTGFASMAETDEFSR